MRMWQASWIWHLDALSKTQVVELSGDEFAESLQGFGSIRKQVEIEFLVLRHLNGTVVNPVIDPVRRHAQFFSQLRRGEVSTDLARMRLATFGEDAMS